MVIENSKQKLYLFTKLDNIKDNLTANNFNARELKKSYKVTAINSKCAILPEKLTGTFEITTVYKERGRYIIKNGEGAFYQGRFLMNIKRDGSVTIFNECYTASGINIIRFYGEEYLNDFERPYTDGKPVFDTSNYKISTKEGCDKLYYPLLFLENQIKSLLDRIDYFGIDDGSIVFSVPQGAALIQNAYFVISPTH